MQSTFTVYRQQHLKNLSLSAQKLPSPLPLWRLEEQRPLGFVGQRGGEMQEANREGDTDVSLAMKSLISSHPTMSWSSPRVPQSFSPPLNSSPSVHTQVSTLGTNTTTTSTYTVWWVFILHLMQLMALKFKYRKVHYVFLSFITLTILSQMSAQNQYTRANRWYKLDMFPILESVAHFPVCFWLLYKWT